MVETHHLASRVNHLIHFLVRYLHFPMLFARLTLIPLPLQHSQISLIRAPPPITLPHQSPYSINTITSAPLQIIWLIIPRSWSLLHSRIPPHRRKRKREKERKEWKREKGKRRKKKGKRDEKDEEEGLPRGVRKWLITRRGARDTSTLPARRGGSTRQRDTYRLDLHRG